MKLTLLAGAAATLMVAAPAFAQDMTVEDQPFTGFYIGGTAGFDSQPNDVGETIEFDRNLDGTFRDSVLTGTGANAFAPGFCNGRANGNRPDTGCTSDRDDFGYYGRVGADQQYGPFVVGVVGEFGKSEIRDSVSAFSVTPANYVLSREIEWEGSIRGRAGFAAKTTLFYGTAGVGYANIKNSFTTTNSVNSRTDSGDEKEFGFLAGGGIEQKIGKNFSIGMEYMFHRYEDRDYRARLGGTAGTPFTNTANGGNANGTDLRRNFDYFRWHSIRGTAAFRF